MTGLLAGAAVPDGFPAEVRPGFDVLVATSDGVTVGAVSVRVRDTVADVDTLWTDPAHEASRPDVLAAVVSRFADRTVTVGVGDDQPALRELLHGAPVFGELMTKPVATPPPAPAPGLGHRPMTIEEYDDWIAAHEVSYAEDGLGRAGGDMELAMERSREDYARLLPDGLATRDQSIVVLLSEDAPVGTLWLAHHQSGGQTFGYDFEIDPARRGEGLGRAAMAVAEQLAAAAGDVSLGLHVFGDNAVAINLYRSWGLRTVRTTYDATGWVPVGAAVRAAATAPHRAPTGQGTATMTGGARSVRTAHRPP